MRQFATHASAASGAPAPGPAPPPPALLLLPAPPDLEPLVEYVWQLVLPRSPGAVWRVVADGYLDLSLVVPLGPDVLRAAAAARRGAPGAARALAEALDAARRVVCGAASASRTVDMDVPQLLTGVRFRIGAAPGILRSTPADLVDGARPLGEVVGGHTAEHAAVAVGAHVRTVGARAAAGDADPPGDPLVAPRLGGDAEDAGAEMMVRTVARAGVEDMARRLMARAAARPGGSRAPDPRVREALHLLDYTASADGRAAGDGADVSAVARALAVSPRTLERLFAEHVGYAPRTYQRLRRVGAVARALEHAGAQAADAPPAARPPADSGLRRLAAPRPAATLSQLAHDLGYTDHAHMTREFTGVMGLSPSRYRREASAAPVEVCGVAVPERATPVGTVGAAATAGAAW